MVRLLLITWIVLASARIAAAQATFFYPPPAPGAITTAKDVSYGESGSVRMAMDVYRPARSSANAPALIFFNQAAGAQRAGFAFYVRWAETAAAKGLVAVVPDLRMGSAADDFRLLLSHLATRAGDYGIDREAVAVYAGSGNVSAALPLLQDHSLSAVKAAVIFYGVARVSEFRRDLPVLMVRAGLDRPQVNAAMASLIALATTQNAPVTLLNHSTGHHGFEMVDDDAATRTVIDRTIEFVKTATSSSYQLALRGGLPEATAAAHVAAGNFREAAGAYAKLVEAKPGDARLRLSYGEALLGDRQFAAACDEFDKLRDKGLGPRDLGLPAARACVQNGDADRAVGWLKSVPQRFLPPDVEEEAVFAPLRGRPDFQALFKR